MYCEITNADRDISPGPRPLVESATANAGIADAQISGQLATELTAIFGDVRPQVVSSLDPEIPLPLRSTDAVTNVRVARLLDASRAGRGSQPARSRRPTPG